MEEKEEYKENNNITVININKLDKSSYKGSKIKINNDRKFKDLWAAILFYICVLGNIGILTYNIIFILSHGNIFDSVGNSSGYNYGYVPSGYKYSPSDYESFPSGYDGSSGSSNMFNDDYYNVSPIISESSGKTPDSSSSYYDYDTDYYGYDLSKYYRHKRGNNLDIGMILDELTGGIMALLSSVIFIIPLLFTILYIYLLESYTKQILKITVFCWIGFYSIVGIGLGILFMPFGFIFLALPITVYLIYHFAWKKRIPFTTVILENVGFVMKKYKATIYIGYIGCFVGTIWNIILFFNIILCFITFPFGCLFEVFVFYYSSQVIKNVIQSTIAGVFGFYFFKSSIDLNNNNIEVLVKNPTLTSFKYSMTYSFGSICYGSLIVAIIKMIRSMVNNIKNNLKSVCYCCLCCCCCFEWLLKTIDRLVQYFNIYAFTEVAIFGKSYIEGAKSTWNLIKKCGIEAILNDILVSRMLRLGNFLVGLVAGVVCAGIAYATEVAKENDELLFIVLIGVLSFCISYLLFSIVAEVVVSGVIALFVCISEDLENIKYRNPILYQKIKDTYPDSLT